jgi:hypothetical protein
VQAHTTHGDDALDHETVLRSLFHRLNNILAHAELMESKATTEAERIRATQVVTSVLDALGTARQIRHSGDGSS